MARSLDNMRNESSSLQTLGTSLAHTYPAIPPAARWPYIRQDPHKSAQVQFQLFDEVLRFEAALHLLNVYEPWSEHLQASSEVFDMF